MVAAWKEQNHLPEIGQLSFEERLGLLVDRELTERENKRLKSRLRAAKLRQQACFEDIDYQHPRGLDRSLMQQLGMSTWIQKHRNVLITGPTGIGKSYIACALAHKACLNGFRSHYYRLPALLHELKVARGDGRYTQLMKLLLRADVLVLDDWGLTTIRADEQRELLEVFEDRYDRKSTLVTSQFPVDRWFETMSDPTLSDAILDRLIHNGYKLLLEGESMRKHYSDLLESNQLLT
jgi:DNA replication protein DnaC